MSVIGEVHTLQVPLQLSHRVMGLQHTSWYRFCTRPGNPCGIGPTGAWSEPFRYGKLTSIEVDADITSCRSLLSMPFAFAQLLCFHA